MAITLFAGPSLASGLRAGLLLASLHHLRGSVLGPAGFLQAWLGGGLREQVLACVGALLEELAQDQRCTMLLTGEHFCRLSKPTVTIPCELCPPPCRTSPHPRLWSQRLR